MIKYSLPGNPYPPQGCPSFLPLQSHIHSRVHYSVLLHLNGTTPKVHLPTHIAICSGSELCKRRTGSYSGELQIRTEMMDQMQRCTHPRPEEPGLEQFLLPGIQCRLEMVHWVVEMSIPFATRVTLLCSFSGVSFVNSLTPRVPQNYSCYYSCDYLIMSDPASCFTFGPPGLSISLLPQTHDYSLVTGSCLLLDTPLILITDPIIITVDIIISGLGLFCAEGSCNILRLLPWWTLSQSLTSAVGLSVCLLPIYSVYCCCSSPPSSPPPSIIRASIVHRRQQQRLL